MGMVLATPYLSIKISWRRPERTDKLLKEEKRCQLAFILFKLQSIHPNPGPGSRDKSDEGRKRRRERRYEKRRLRREAKLQEELRLDRRKKKKIKYSIVTWNVQRMTLRDLHKRKAKIVAEHARKNKWDAVLLSEVLADGPGVVWLGEEENLTVIIHSKKAGILLRGSLLDGWKKEGQKKKVAERSVSVRACGLALTATYLPVYVGTNEDEIENTKEVLAEHVRWAKYEDVVIVGGDYNAHVGSDEEKQGVCGKFGLRTSNEKGRQLIQWCEENNLAYVNSFYNMKNRGSWFNRMNGRWYELDGFIMRKEQRHRYIKKISTIGEMTLSDHKPKKIEIELKQWHWPTVDRKKVPKIRWERLRDLEIDRLFKAKVDELLENNDIEDREEGTGWTEIVNVTIAAAKEVCGEQERRVENPWMIGKEERLQQLRSRINGAVTRRNEIRERQADGDELVRAIEDLKDARKIMKKELRDWEKEWWEDIISRCKEAGERGDAGTMYKTLKELGVRDWKGPVQTTNLTTEQFKVHFEKVSKDKFENLPEEIDRVVNEVEDLSQTRLAREWRETLDAIPGREEILTQMRKMRDSAPGGDGVRLIYLLRGGQMLTDRLIETIQYMFMNGSEEWEEGLKTGLVIPLHKKGDRDDPNKYRGVCLLALASRIVARIMADRIRLWSEDMNLLDDDQAGFRKGRSTADITQVLIRIQEDTVDLRRRKEQQGETIVDGEEPVARLLDLRKAYPRVNRPALWGILKKYGMGERALRVLQDLHESTMYRIRGKEGESEAWLPNRGLREGCPSSPVLFNVFHQVVMRQATKARKRKAEEMDLEVGLAFNWVPGSSFPGVQWEMPNSEAKKIRIDKGLFADDTNLVGRKKEMVEGLKSVKEVMDKFEERNNEDKEEEIVFGSEDSNKIRILGSYLGPLEDGKQRLKRAGATWAKVKSRLKGSRLSKKTQARVVEATVESTLLFDAHARTWQVTELKKLQSCVDKMYRHVWSRKTKPPLRQMEEEGKNMQDLRNELGLKSVRLKVEKRCLERIGHVMRMEDDRIVKAAVLGWMEDLEGVQKMKGKKRKTVLYWKQLVKEAGIDKTKIGKETSNRKEWKMTVKERIKHLEKWERRGGKRSQEERGVRNQLRQQEDELKCDECDKICKSKAGLVNHIRTKHNISSQKVMHKCNLCEQIFPYKSNLTNHQTICVGLFNEDPNMKRCDKCMKLYTSGNFARHRRTCGRDREEREAAPPRRLKGERANCSLCNTSQSKSNMSRHQKSEACRIMREANL